MNATAQIRTVQYTGGTLWTLQLNGSCLVVRVQLDRVWRSGTVSIYKYMNILSGFVLSLHACQFVFVYVCVLVFVYLCICGVQLECGRVAVH